MTLYWRIRNFIVSMLAKLKPSNDPEEFTFGELIEEIETRTDEENQAIIDFIQDYDAIDALERKMGAHD